MNRNGSIGFAVTSLFALYLLFVMIIVFLAAAFLISIGKDIEIDNSEIELEGFKNNAYPELEKELDAFLNKRVSLNNDTNVIELVDNIEIDEDGAEKFEKEAILFFEEEFPFPLEGWKGVYPWWIRVYDKK